MELAVVTAGVSVWIGFNVPIKNYVILETSLSSQSLASNKNQETEHINNTMQKGALVNSTTHTQKI